MTTMTEPTGQESRHASISPLQAEAWEVANRSYHVPDGTLYRDLGLALYRKDMQQRIKELLARLDEQNAHLDALSGEEDR